MSSAGQPSLHLLTLNVNGLGSAAKRTTLFSVLLSGSWDIVVLQETHHENSEQGERWAREGAGLGKPWEGQTFWAHGTTASRGVAILIRDRVHLTDLVVAPSVGQGRLIRVDFTWEDHPLTVIGVYAPSVSADRSTFFVDSLLPFLPQDRQVLLGGDFNCVPSDLDVTPNARGRRRTGYIGGLQTVEETFELIDAWRELHPSEISITHTCFSHGSGARLDRWLTSPAFRAMLTDCRIVDGLPGDHQAVALRVTAIDRSSVGPGPWTFPLHLLDVPQYTAEASSLLRQYLLDHPISPQLSHRSRWDALKLELRDHSTAYTFGVGRRQRAALKRLEDQVQRARAQFLLHPTRPSVLTAWQGAVQDLQGFHTVQAERAAVRAGVLWQQYGEQSTFYFHHLSRQRKRATALTGVLDSHASGEVADLRTSQGRKLGGEVLASFFSSDSPHGLFAPTPTDQQAQADMLSAIDANLSQEAAAACEGEEPLTLQDLTDCLAGMPRAKQPGSDGLSYEVLQQFWGILGQPLLDVFLEAFHDTATGTLSTSQLLGTIVLIYKGTGARTDPGAYRPITLLNTDAKLLGKVLADRWGRHLTSVVDPTQTAFLPGRWIGDNVLSHQEELDFLESAGEPGCIAFLDFAKAYDRLDRDWVLQCMGALGLGVGAQRWVSLLQDGMQGRVRFNGWLSPSFPVRAGLPQGSPLSPLLYVIAAQPLAAHLRREVANGALQAISLPDGNQAPPSHQHADDTTIHLRTRADIGLALAGSVHLYCLASGSRINAAKSHGMELGNPAAAGGVDLGTGIPFTARGESIRHLGVRLNTTPLTAEAETYTSILGAIRNTALHWAARNLTMIGRVHVAKQVLASKVTYHATFVPAPAWFVKDLTACLQRFITGGALALRPCREAFALPWEKGGMRLVTIPVMIASLQAKIVSRLLEPERLLWKTFLLSRLTCPQHWLEQHPDRTPRVVDTLGYGARAIFSTRRLADLGVLSPRVLSYLRSYRELLPHRLVAPQKLTTRQALREPIFHNTQIMADAAPLRPTGPLSALLTAGVTSVGDLSRDLGCPTHLITQVRGSLPPSWLAALSAPAEPLVGDFTHPLHPGLLFTSKAEVGTAQLLWTACTIGADGRLTELLYCPSFTHASLCPALAVKWDTARRWRPLTGRRKAAVSDPGRYYLGEESGSAFDPDLWGVADRPSHELVVREAADRLTCLAAVSAGVTGVVGNPIRPAIWEGGTTPGRYGSRTLAATEQRWVQVIAAALQGPATPGTAATRSGESLQYQASWMAPSGRSRQHWRDRQAEAPPPPAVAPRILIRPDTQDAASPPQPCPAPPWAPVWARLQDLALDRSQRLLAWQLLHGTLRCGAFRAVIDIKRGITQSLEAIRETAACPRPGCQGTHETISHMLFTCPTASRVWEWVLAMWVAITDLPAPPLSLPLLLADDQRQWRPPRTLQALWTQLRLCTLHSLHTQATGRRRGQINNAPTVAARVVGALRGAIFRDWSRVTPEGGLQGLASGLCCSTWLRGRHPLLIEPDFLRLWGHREVLAKLHTGDLGGGRLLSVRLSVSHPVPIPMGGSV
jgi:exonuclease III